MQRRCRVGADHGADIDHRRHGAAERHERAEIAIAADAHAEKLAVLVERKRGIDDIIACVIVADMRFAAGLGPFHRPADASRRPQHQNDFRIDRAAQAVGAADIAGDQAQFGFGNFQRGAGNIVAEQPGPLKAAMQGVALRAGVVDADNPARLDRIGGDAIDDESLLDHMRRIGKGRVGLGLVAGLIEIGLVAGAIVVKLRCVFFCGVSRRDDSGPRRIIDGDMLSRITG